MSANDELQAHTCEKILQECGDVANNVAQANSQDLTEQWKKGELQGGWYFLEFENGSKFPVYYCGFNREFEFGWDWKISKVLAPVPSYEEYLTMKDCAKMVFEAAERETKLKELLKEVRDAWVIYKPYDRHQLCKRIDNAIGEKK